MGDSDSLQGMTNPIARIVLVNYSQSVVLPALSQSQVSEVPDLSPLRVVIGTTIVSFVPLAVDLWWARDLSLRLMTSFVQNVLRKNSWQIQLNNKHTLNLTFFLHFSPKTNKCYTNTRLLLAKGVIRFRGIL